MFRNQYNLAKTPEDVCVFTEVMDTIIDPEKIAKWDLNNKLIKVKENKCLIDQSMDCIDVSLQNKGPEEDRIYQEDPMILKNLRRGNTIIKYLDSD